MSTADLSTLFAALADPTRRAILARLSAGEAPVKDLGGPLALSRPAITKHLHVLERAGLISRGREGQLRPCRLEPRALAPAVAWMDPFRALWDERLDRLDGYLKTLAAAAATKTPANAAPPTTAGKPPRMQAPKRRSCAKPRNPGDPRGRKP